MHSRELALVASTTIMLLGGNRMISNRIGRCMWPGVVWSCRAALSRMLPLLVALLVLTAPVSAQIIPCPSPTDLTTQRLPEIVSSGGILRGNMVLSDTQQAFQISNNNGNRKCVPQLL